MTALYGISLRAIKMSLFLKRFITFEIVREINGFQCGNRNIVEVMQCREKTAKMHTRSFPSVCLLLPTNYILRKASEFLIFNWKTRKTFPSLMIPDLWQYGCQGQARDAIDPIDDCDRKCFVLELLKHFIQNSRRESSAKHILAIHRYHLRRNYKWWAFKI